MRTPDRLRSLMLVCAFIALAAIAGGGERQAVASAPISLHPENPHYFLWRGRPTLLIPEGQWRAEWIDTLTGAVVRTSDVDGGGIRALPPPDFAVDIALRLRRQ